LIARGRSVVLTYEPGGTPLGDAVRRILLEPNRRERINPRTEVLLFSATRAQLVDDVIAPALQQGQVVVSDRYVDSTIAYQCGGRGLPPQEVEPILRFATGGLTPDLTFLLDLDVSAGLARKCDSASDRLENEDRAFHERVRRAYLSRAEQFPERIVVLNGLLSPDELSLKIQERVGNWTRHQGDRRSGSH
jgi:dTMP kinase